MESTVYEIEREWVTSARWAGYLMVLIAAVFVGPSLYDPQEFPIGPGLFGAAFCGVLAFLCIRSGYWPEVHSVEISDLGVRGVSSGAFVPWSGVARLRERAFLQRVDLVGDAGPTGISLEYQLERFDEALARVVEHVRTSGLPAPTSFGRPWTSAGAIFNLAGLLGMTALGLWLWYSEETWAGLVFVVVMAGLFMMERSGEISRVTLSQGVLAMHGGKRAAEYALGDIASVRLALRPLPKGRFSLDVYVEAGGELIPIRPIGADAFELFRAVKTEVERAGGRSVASREAAPPVSR